MVGTKLTVTDENLEAAARSSASEVVAAVPHVKKPHFQNNGMVLKQIQAQLIFWGTAWAAADVGNLTDAIKKIVGSPYMDDLKQYGVESGQVVGNSKVIAIAVDTSPADPPNPFTSGDVELLLTNLLNSATISDFRANSQLCYCVFMPPNVRPSEGFLAEHSSFQFKGVTAHYLWVSHGDPDFITTAFSHEFVEATTDPEGNGVVGGPGTCDQAGPCEIGDVCTGTTGKVNGVSVQGYWSEHAGTCVVPGGTELQQAPFRRQG